MDDLSLLVPSQRHPYPQANRLASAQAWRERMQFAFLLQIAEQGCANAALWRRSSRALTRLT